MKTNLQSIIFEGGQETKSYNKDFSNEAINQIEHHINNDYVKGVKREIDLNGIYLSMLDIHATQGYQVDVSHDFALFKIHFEIEGSNEYTPHTTNGKHIFIPSGHFNLFYLPEVKGTLRYNTKRRKTLEIKFSKFLIHKLFGNDFHVISQEFEQAVAEQKPFLLWPNSRPISKIIQNLLHEIMNCDYTDSLKKAYLEAKISELITTIFVDAKQNTETKISTTPQLIAVTEYIKNNLDKNLTIAELATVAVLNGTKLKQEFKSAYGSTIFKYITKKRMEKAKDLIQNKTHNISEASYMVGYKNPQHFTVAYKKLFNQLPSELLG